MRLLDPCRTSHRKLDSGVCWRAGTSPPVMIGRYFYCVKNKGGDEGRNLGHLGFHACLTRPVQLVVTCTKTIGRLLQVDIWYKQVGRLMVGSSMLCIDRWCSGRFGGRVVEPHHAQPSMYLLDLPNPIHPVHGIRVWVKRARRGERERERSDGRFDELLLLITRVRTRYRHPQLCNSFLAAQVSFVIHSRLPKPVSPS